MCLVQVELVEQLCAIATEVKAARDAHRQTTLVRRLKQLSQMFTGCIRLPLNPSLQVWGINIEVYMPVEYSCPATITLISAGMFILQLQHGTIEAGVL